MTRLGLASRLAAAVVALAAMAGAGASAELAPPQRVQLAQSALGILDFGPLAVDGIAGAATDRALAAAAAAFGWNDTATLDADTVDRLNRAAAAALAARHGIAFDGRWTLDPGWWDDDLTARAGLTGPVSLAEACAAPLPVTFTIDGLLYAPAGGGRPWILIEEYDRLVPVPPEGRPPYSEAHGFAVVDADTLETLTEGDTARWRRCPDP
ncbi:MAG: hypothetical protein R3F55_18235 [Alphaproteobacteria bacterium]